MYGIKSKFYTGFVTGPIDYRKQESGYLVWGGFDMNIFVGNLSLELTEDELMAYLDSKGEEIA